MSFIDQAEILEKTDGGLNIILELFPDAENVLSKKNDKFKMRAEEKTASASIKKLADGTWVVTDFGGDQKPRNAVSLFMHVNNVTYRQALEILAERLQISGTTNAVNLKPDYEKRAPADNETVGNFYYTPREATELELRTIGPLVKQEHLTRYNVWAVAEYRYVREDSVTKLPVAHCFKSTEQYPIFMLEVGDWRKRYEPLNPDKAARFRHDGTREKDYIFGLAQCQKAYDDLNKDRDPESDKEKKLPEIILCSGDRDALNVASMGYQVIWLNSETATLTGKQFNKLKTLADKIYNVPDLDATGHRQGNALALEYLDIYTIRLPKELLQRKDWRGNSCKDLRDFMKYYKPYDFKELMNVALPFRLWDEQWKKTDDSGNGFMEYRINLAQTYNFLQQMGYYRFELPNTKTGYTYIKIEDNIVREVTTVQIKAFIFNFLKGRKLSPKLLNSFYRAQNQLSDASLSNLDVIDIDFTDCDKESQFLFFQNTTWQVTKTGIKELLPGSSTKFVWDDEVIKHNATVAPQPPFTVIYNEEQKRYNLNVADDACLFFKYLRNASRMHWRQELEEEKPLTEEQKQEEEDHLINKLYSLGYLMHRYKNPNRPWCVFAMDNKISESGESHGGSGKSIAYKAPRYFMQTVTLQGRNPKLTDNQHIYENVTRHTDYLLVDDANQYLKFDFFFSDITGEMVVNPKHGKQYELAFDDVPKFAITSNYTLRNIDPSTVRRLLYTVFSDYYHFNKDGEYRESRSPFDDFGKNLFIDFTEAEWNQLFNTMAACIQIYLTFPKIDPPMVNVEKRNLRTIMGEMFLEWADIYFAQGNHHVDCLTPKGEAFENFKIIARSNHWSPNKFTKCLHAWVKYNDFTINPPSLVNDSKGRIMVRKDSQILEHIYIKAYSQEIHRDAVEKSQEPIDYDLETSDEDRPF